MVTSLRLPIAALLAWLSFVGVARATVDGGDLVVTDLFGFTAPHLSVFDSAGGNQSTFDLLSCFPYDVEVDSAGEIFVSGGQTDMVYRVAPGATPECTIVGHTGIATALGMALAPSGILFVADSSQIIAIDPDAFDPGDLAANREVVGSGGDLAGADDVAIDADGMLVVATTLGPVVRLDPDAYEPGDPTSNQERVGLGTVSNGADIAIGPSGNLVVVEISISSRIVRYDPNSFDTMNPGANQLQVYTGFSLPTSAVFDAAGRLLVLDDAGIFEVDLATGMTSLLAAGTFNTPFAKLAVAPTRVAMIPALGAVSSGILVTLLCAIALWSLRRYEAIRVPLRSSAAASPASAEVTFGGARGGGRPRTRSRRNR